MTKQWKQKTWFRAADGTKGSNKLVAELAGVTSGTVSNVFNCPEKVIPETQKRVRDGRIGQDQRDHRAHQQHHSAGRLDVHEPRYRIDDAVDGRSRKSRV